MRIVTRAVLLTLPNGILFQRYEPIILEGLCRFDGTGGMTDDFVYSCLTGSALDYELSEAIDKWEEMEKDGVSGKKDFDIYMRDGMSSNPRQLYVVWEKEDLESLKKIVDAAIQIS